MIVYILIPSAAKAEDGSTMTKEVLIAISGLQFEVDEDQAVEVITVGEYYYKNGKHYILYEEVQEGEGVTKNTIKISDHQVDILKKGANNVHMVFEENKQNLTYYNTMYGELLIRISTTRVQKKEEENLLLTEIDYGLDINYNHISDCSIRIKICSKNVK